MAHALPSFATTSTCCMKQQYQSDAGKWLEILYGDEKAPLDYQVSGIESYRTYLFRQAKKYSFGSSERR